MSAEPFPTVELDDAAEFAAGMIDITPELQEEALDEADEMDAEQSEATQADELAQGADLALHPPDPLDQLES
jgi:hypothetical protein